MKESKPISNKRKHLFTASLFALFLATILTSIMLLYYYIIIAGLAGFSLLVWGHSEFSRKKFGVILVFVTICLFSITPIYAAKITTKYRNVAQNVATPIVIDYFKNELGSNYTYRELIVWENAHLTFTYDEIQRNTDPIKIYEYGKGRCEEFAILYSALCISQGYDCRIVNAPFNDHMWNEIKLNDTWTRVDSSLNSTSPRAIGYPEFFEKEKGWTPPLLALAFEGSSVIDVTSTYNRSQINIVSIHFIIIVIIAITYILYRVAKRSERLIEICQKLKRKEEKGVKDAELTRSQAETIKDAATQTRFTSSALLIAFISGLVGLLTLIIPYVEKSPDLWIEYTIILSVIYFFLDVGLCMSFYSICRTTWLIDKLITKDKKNVKNFLEKNWKVHYTWLIKTKQGDFRKSVVFWILLIFTLWMVLLLLRIQSIHTML